MIVLQKVVGIFHIFKTIVSKFHFKKVFRQCFSDMGERGKFKFFLENIA